MATGRDVAAGHTLPARLRALRAAPEPLTALLADLRGIEHGSDPRFAMTLDHYLESWLGSRPREVFRLAGPRLLILAPADCSPLLEAGAKALAQTLLTHGFGVLRSSRYDVATEIERLIADLFPADPLGGDGNAALREAADRAPTAALADLLTVERVLHGADIESIVREQPVWALGDEPPSVATTELAVSLEELEARLSLSLRRDAWLRHEVAVRLDRGLLRHIARDRARDHRPLSVDLHCATVLDAAPGAGSFGDLVGAIPAAMRGRITAEIAYWELTLAPGRVAAAAARLVDAGFAVAFDHVPLSALATPGFADGVAEVRPAFVKIQWVPGTGEAAEALAAAAGRFGASRLVLWRCDEPAAVECGRAAGLVLFQGRAADAAAGTAAATPRRISETAPARTREVAGPDAEAAPAAEAALADTAPPARPGLLDRLFGRG